MKGKWTRRLAGLLAAALLMPTPAALAADSSTGDSPDPKTATVTIVNGNTSHVQFDPSDKVELTDTESASFTLETEAGYRLDRITITIEPNTTSTVSDADSSTSLVLDRETLSGDDTKNGISAQVEQWPAYSNICKLTVSAGTLSGDVDVSISAFAPGTTHKAEIDKPEDGTVGGGNEYGNGEKATLSVTPHQGYRLKSLQMTYKVNGITETNTVSSSCDWKGLKIDWSDIDQTTVSGPLYGDLKVTPSIEKIPVTCKVRIYVDDGLELDRPGSESTTVNEGESLSVRVSTQEGYLIDQMLVQVGKTYATWTPGQSYFMVNYDRISVRESDDSVSFVLPEITDDVTIEFVSTYDENNIPIKLEEGSHINIDSDVGDTVARGEDAAFTISTTSDRYAVKTITVRIGEKKASADPDDETIRVGNRNYEIQDNGNGEYTLYIDNIREPVTVEATSNSSGTVSRPSLTINSSSNMKITKSVSGSRIDAGDSVRFYFTPNKNYQVDEITVKIGDSSRTVGADKTSIRVGGESYRMSRNADGVVTLYLDDIRANVTVSGRAYYSKDSVKPTGTVKLNTASRSAFLDGYADGTFRPEAKMTRAEAVVMLYRLSDVSNASGAGDIFIDVPGNLWCADEINAFANAGIIDVTSYFHPNQYITRAEFVEMLYRLMGSPSYSRGTLRFRDVTGTANETAIYYAVSRGWVDGYADGTFRPFNYIARSEVAALMTRLLNRTSGGSGGAYKDVSRTHWAYRYIQLASSYV
ncbi:S-layer homology domain-containing protein [Agathobaculum desmolans]|uniref:S-layer homology domain-containing protein n=1 Tax=Agathobaculum desmolans TaxID=39484 RepID=UPI0005552124|nr:S-layer homology domain-containing protein [Agathobaculum desmolans]